MFSGQLPSKLHTKEFIISQFDSQQSGLSENKTDNIPEDVQDYSTRDNTKELNDNPSDKLAREYIKASGQGKAVEPNKRIIALLMDLVVCYLVSILISVAISIIPFLPNLLPQPLLLTVLFIFRDYFFAGKGLGKNLMHLKVVDMQSGQPLTLKQSFLRNITLTAPLLVVQLVAMLPGALLPVLIREILNILETVYSIIFLPLESYRAFSRKDSLRIGDELARTRIIQSQTSFDQFVPKNKN